MNTATKKVLFLTTIDVTVYAFLIPHMKLLQNMGYEVEVACAKTKFFDAIEKEGFKVYDIPFNRNPLRLDNLKAIFRLYRLMKRNNYVMLHTHTPVASFVGRIVGKITKIPHIVYTAHGFHFHEIGSNLKNFIYYRLEKLAGRLTDVLITINIDDYKIAKEKRIALNGKIVYIKGVGIDTQKFDPSRFGNLDLNQCKKNLGIQDNDSLIMSVAELSKRKNIKDIIKCISVVSNPSLKLLVVGNGALKEKLQNLANKLNLSDKTLFLGRRDDVSNLLSFSNILVLTSYQEGLPVSVMEAMAMEKPVVAYNIRGVRDLIEDGVNGFLVPFGDIGGLANKIVYLLENPEIAKEFGKRGREKIEREFNLKEILKDMEELYKEILGDSN